ncbi:MAG: ribosome silencing factor [Lachnospiraceae bacterium]|nr:ribosome silencing factor [Lachnospiraceae bacterium]
MDSREKAKIAVSAMEDKKAEDIRVIEISEVSSIGDYFIICNGSNISQVQAITDEIDERLGRQGVTAAHVEGYRNAGWILMDYSDVIIHVFDKDNRLFYNLERIWKDGKEIDSGSL